MYAIRSYYVARNVRIVRSSGDAQLDASAVRAVETASPLPWVYDPAAGEPGQGVEPGTAWDEVPDTFLCPECFMGKDDFEPVASVRRAA